MPTLESYRQALEKMSQADKARKEAFQQIGSWRSGDKKGVAKAKQLLDEFKSESETFQKRFIGPLEKRFLSGEPEATDEVIAILSVDASSYRSGYRKEVYYRRLKKITLSDTQIASLKSIAPQRCASSEYRREDRELRLLMVKLADIEFLNAVAEISSKKGSHVDGHKERMIQVILHSRKDLRDKFNSVRKQKS